MAFLDLAREIIILILKIDLDSDRLDCRRLGLLLPMDRLAAYITEQQDYVRAELPSCLTPSLRDVQILSEQGTDCAEDRNHALPRIFQLCHICSSIRNTLLSSPLLWAGQALCWPAHLELILQRAQKCGLTLVSSKGLCACIFSDIRPALLHAICVKLILPSTYIRTDGTHLLTTSLVRHEIIRASLLTDIELRFDGNHFDHSAALPFVVISCLRRARLQNTNFILSGPSLEVLHLATEPGAPAFTLQQFLDAIRPSPNLRELAVQNSVIGDYELPWEAAHGARIALPGLEHLSCSGSRGFARAVLYWISVSPTVDLSIDAELALGAIDAPFDRVPAQLAAELYVLLHPSETYSALEHARRWAAAEAASVPFTDVLPEVSEASIPPAMPCLLLNVICDSESRYPESMWPRLVTIAAAQDREGALRSAAQFGDPVSLGPGRLRRTFTMRNLYAAFPNDGQVALREGFPRHNRPSHLGMTASLPVTAWLCQADAEEHILFLAFAQSSWVPRTEDEWLFVLADLPQLRVIEVFSLALGECAKSLASYLLREQGNEELREIVFHDCGPERRATAKLQAEVEGLTMAREVDPESGSTLPHIVWRLN